MIKITLEFKGVDEAIVALGKLVGAPVATAASSPVGAEKPVAPTTRKPRADAGKKRGSYKNAEAPAAPAEGDKPQPSGVTPPAASTPETAAPEKAEATTPPSPGAEPVAAAPKEEDAQAALEAVFTSKGLPAAQKLLAGAGVSRLRDLPAEKRATFIEAAKEAIK